MHRTGEALSVVFVVRDAPPGLVWPEADGGGRTDGLWRSTCFEAFVRAPGSDAYVELNFAPSGRWAAYAFDGRRAGMRPLDFADGAAPVVGALRSGEAERTLVARVDLSAAPGLAGAPWSAAITAVLDDGAGGISYWALAHAPGKPDFHRPEGFVLDLPPPPET